MDDFIPLGPKKDPRSTRRLFIYTGDDGLKYGVHAHTPEEGDRIFSTEFLARKKANALPDLGGVGNVVHDTALGVAGMVPGSKELAAVPGAIADSVGDEKTSFMDAWEKEKNDLVTQHAAASERSPIGYGIGQIGGGAAVSSRLPGFKGMVNSPTTRGRMGYGGLNGMIFGAAEGAGAGEGLWGRLGRAGEGAAWGGPLGVLGQGAAEAAGALWQHKIGPAARTLFGRGDEAGNIAGRKVTEEHAYGSPGREVGGRGLNDTEFADAQAEGLNPLNIDRAGWPGNATLRAAGDRTSSARSKALDTLRKRDAGTADRWKSMFDQYLPENLVETRRMLKSHAQRATRPFYEAAERSPGAQQMWDSTFERMAISPPIQAAMKKAALSTKAAQGRVRPDAGRMRGEIKFKKDGTYEVVETPNLQYWNQVKIHLDEMEERAIRSPDKRSATMVAEIDAARRDLLGVLDQRVPNYAAAREAGGRYLGEESAGKLSEKFLKSRDYDINDVQSIMRRWTAAEREEARLSMLDGMRRRMQQMDYTHDSSRAMWRSPDEEKIAKEVLGPEVFGRLDRRNKLETLYRQAYTNISGGSPTAQRQQALKEIATLSAPVVGGGGVGYMYGGDVTSAATGAAVGGVARAGSAGARAILKQIGEKAYTKLDNEIVDRFLSGDPSVLPSIEQLIESDKKMRGMFSLITAGVRSQYQDTEEKPK